MWFVFIICLEVFTPAVCNMCIYEGLNIAQKDVLTESYAPKGCYCSDSVKGSMIKLVYCKYVNSYMREK
jgi:hypothetical protein